MERSRRSKKARRTLGRDEREGPEGEGPCFDGSTLLERKLVVNFLGLGALELEEKLVVDMDIKRSFPL